MDKRQPLLYFSGKEVRVGDIVQYGDSQGEIVFIITSGSYSEKYPKSTWDYLKEGFGIETQKYGLIHAIEPDEDLTLISRKGQIAPLEQEVMTTRKRIKEIEAKALKKLKRTNNEPPDDQA
jgi:hypothetical protein